MASPSPRQSQSPGGGNDEDSDEQINIAGVQVYSVWLERFGWGQVFLSFLTQIAGAVSFPGYNVVLALWTCYSAYSQETKPLFICLCFTILSVILDGVFCLIWGVGDVNLFEPSTGEAAVKFCLILLILNLFLKLVSLLAGLLLYLALGGHVALRREGQRGGGSKGRRHHPGNRRRRRRSRGSGRADGGGGGGGAPGGEGGGAAGIAELVSLGQKTPSPRKPGNSGIGELASLT